MYQLRGRLGRWGLGELYEAIDTESGRVRMLKIVRGRRAQDTHIRHHMRHEYEAACTVLHPSIVKIHALEEDPNLGLYHVMDVVRGETLSAAHKRGLTFFPDKVLEFVGATASALASLEAHGIGHFEFSPDSLFIPNGTGGKTLVPLTINFGLPPNEDRVPPLPLEALAYAAPERRASTQWDHRADVYSTCAILMQLLLGRTPPPQGWVRPPALSDDVDALGRNLYEIAQRGLSSIPAQRYPSMQALYAALSFLAASATVTLPAPASQTTSKKSARPQPAYQETRTVLGMGTQGQKGQATIDASGDTENPTSPQMARSPNTSPPPLPTQSRPANETRPQKRSQKKTVLGIGAIAAVSDQQPPKVESTQTKVPMSNGADQPLEPLAFPGGETGAQLTLEPSEVTDLGIPGFSGTLSSNRKWTWIAMGGLVVAALVVAAVVWIAHRRTAGGRFRTTASPEVATNTQPDAGTSSTGPTAKRTHDKDAGVTSKQNAQTTRTAGQRDAGPGVKTTIDAAGTPKQKPDAAMHQTANTFKDTLKRGRRALRHHQYQEAKTIFLKAERVYKGSATIKRLLGDTYYRMHNYWKAKWWYHAALKRSPRSASLHVRMGKTYSHLGKSREACRHFVRALHLRPNSRRYRMNVENYRCR